MPEKHEVAGAVELSESDVLKALVSVRGREIARRLGVGNIDLPPGFALDVSRHRGLAVVAPSGELDVNSAPALRETLGRLVEDGPVVVDLRAVEFIDSMGLGALIAARRRSAVGRVALVADADQESLHKLFSTTSLDRVFPICETVDAAVEALTTDNPE